MYHPGSQSLDHSRILRGLKVRCISTVLLLCAIALLSGWMIFDQSKQGKFNSMMLNLSGRQRSLVSQARYNIVRYRENIEPSQHEQIRFTILNTIKQIESAHQTILRGDEARNIPPAPEGVQRVLRSSPYELDRHLSSFIESCYRAIDRDPDTENIVDNGDPGSTVFYDDQGFDQLMRGLEATVIAYEEYTDGRLSRLRYLGVTVLGVMLLTVLMIATLVFWPLIYQLRHETERLDLANDALAARTNEAEEAAIESRLARDRVQTQKEAMLNVMEDLRMERARLTTEIYDRKQAEQRFETVVESAPNSLLLVDENGTILLVNAQTEKLFGYSRGELVGSNVDMLVPNHVRPNHPQLRAKFFSNPQHAYLGDGRDLSARHKDGSEFAIEIGLSPVRQGNKLIVLASIIDITSRKEAELKLKAHAEELEQLTTDLELRNRELDQFTHVASHDLREPLRSIMSFSSMLEEDAGPDLPQQAKDDLLRITSAAARMQKLIESLLELSRAGRMEIDQSTVSLELCIEQAIEALDTNIEETGAQITRDPHPTVVGNRTLLTQLYQNFIGNAIKYCERDPIIHLTAESPPDGEKGDVVLGVRDNGIGIDEANFQQIFEPFKRLHARNKYDGTGIGLATCAKVIQRHGGKVWVESTPGEGSYFRFTLPHSPVQTPVTDLVTEA